MGGGSVAPSLPSPRTDLMILWADSCSFPDERWQNMIWLDSAGTSANPGK